MFIAKFKNGIPVEGNKYELQEDQTHTLFEVKCDDNGKEIEKKEISRGHKLV
jgi:hypothetical protein